MGEQTKIEWTDYTFNPWIGCTKVAPGCVNCYAEADMAIRRGRVKWGPNGTRSMTTETYWRQPLAWDRRAKKEGVRRRVFCASLADVFEDWGGPIINNRGEQLQWNASHGIGPWQGMGEYARAATMHDLRQSLGYLVRQCPYLDFIMLTKRPENAPAMLEAMGLVGASNVWLITSVSEQESADRNIPLLLECRNLVPVLGVSAEPLLGEIALPAFALTLDWVIVGGESGPQARSCTVGHVRSLVEQCQSVDVPVFVKQLGAKPWLDYYEDSAYREVALDRGLVLDGRQLDVWNHQYHGQPAPGSVVELKLNSAKGGDPDEWPEDLRVREWPCLAAAISG